MSLKVNFRKFGCRWKKDSTAEKDLSSLKNERDQFRASLTHQNHSSKTFYILSKFMYYKKLLLQLKQIKNASLKFRHVFFTLDQLIHELLKTVMTEMGEEKLKKEFQSFA